MLIHCACCKRIIGDKPPYRGDWDNDTADTICEFCLEEQGISLEMLEGSFEKEKQ